VIDKTRLEIANKVLAVLSESYRKTEFVVSDRNRLYLNWFDYYGKAYSRPWATRCGSAYPSWSDKLSCGGTMMTAIAQLALWVRGLPCYPIQTWEYWCGETVGMRGGEKILPLLRDSGCYPDGLSCAFCGARDVERDWYWFSPHPKHSGFGCQRPECQPIIDLRNSLDVKQQNRVKRILSSQRIPASVK